MFYVFHLAPWQYQLLEPRETIILSRFTLCRASQGHPINENIVQNHLNIALLNVS